MPITVFCKCGHSLRIKDEFHGRKVRCPECAEVLVVKERRKARRQTARPRRTPRSAPPVSRAEGSPTTKKRRRRTRNRAVRWKATAIAAAFSLAALSLGYVVYSRYLTGWLADSRTASVDDSTIGSLARQTSLVELDDSDRRKVVFPQIGRAAGKSISTTRSGAGEQWQLVLQYENHIQFERMTNESYRAYALQKDAAQSTPDSAVWSLLVSKPEVTASNQAGWLFHYISTSDRIITSSGKTITHPNADMLNAFNSSLKAGVLSESDAITALNTFVDARSRVAVFRAIADDTSFSKDAVVTALQLMGHPSIAPGLIVIELPPGALMVPYDFEQFLSQFMLRPDFDQEVADTLIDSAMSLMKAKRIEVDKVKTTNGSAVDGPDKPFWIPFDDELPILVSRASPEALVKFTIRADGTPRKILPELRKAKTLSESQWNDLLTARTDSSDLNFLVGQVSVSHLIDYLKTAGTPNTAAGDGEASIEYMSEYALNIHHLPEGDRDSLLTTLIRQYDLSTETIVKACVRCGETTRGTLRQHLQELSPEARKAAQSLAHAEAESRQRNGLPEK